MLTCSRQAGAHYHVPADAYRRGASREAEGHVDRAQAHGRLAHTATRVNLRSKSDDDSDVRAIRVA